MRFDPGYPREPDPEQKERLNQFFGRARWVLPVFLF
ncbi:MAG: helix-turn-helix domain-containing protein [Clostridia bacterium]|nr:helix-turn-helix domain-containing protein [Clostridia bacterium]